MSADRADELVAPFDTWQSSGPDEDGKRLFSIRLDDEISLEVRVGPNESGVFIIRLKAYLEGFATLDFGVVGGIACKYDVDNDGPFNLGPDWFPREVIYIAKGSFHRRWKDAREIFSRPAPGARS